MSPFIISNIIKGFIPFCLFIWGIFMTKAASYTFIGLYVAFQAYLFLIDFSKPNPDPSAWSPDEIEILRKYHLAFRFPSGAKEMSCQLNGLRWVGLLFLTPLLLWNHMWIAGAITVVCFFITGPISVRLDPFFFLEYAANRGQQKTDFELAMLERVSDKLNKTRDRS
jgi:hypothetical protein